jgi:hypothetical protein
MVTMTVTVPKKYVLDLSIGTHDTFTYFRSDVLLNLSRYLNLTYTIKVRQRVGHTLARLKYWLHSRNTVTGPRV